MGQIPKNKMISRPRIASSVSRQLISTQSFGRWVLLGLILFQWLLFRAFVAREVSWSPFLNGDANDYLGHSYIVFDSLLHGRGIPDEFRFGPHGIGPLILSSFMYLLFGPSRLTALLPNLVFFIFFQLVTYTVVRRLAGSVMLGLMSVGLLLCLQIPFQLNPNLLLNIMEYQREFLVFSLFGITIWWGVISNGFRNLRFSLLTGLVAGITVDFRYVMLFHIVGIFSCFSAMWVLFLSFEFGPTRINWTNYFPQIRNFLLSVTIFSAVAFYPLYLAKAQLFGHYFSGTISGAQDENFIALYQQGVKTFLEQVSYYPNAIINVFLGEIFFAVSVVVSIVPMFYIVLRFMHRKSVRQIAPGIPAERIDRRAAYVFCSVAIVVPLALLTFYPTRSGQMGEVVAAPIFIMVVLAIIDLYYLGLKRLAERAANFVKACIAALVILVGLIFQLNAYSMAGLSSLAKKDYREVGHLYDDIARFASLSGTDRPTIATDFLENYTIGCGKAITAYYYETQKKLLRPTCVFPTDVGTVYDYMHARDAMIPADLLILSLEETSLDALDPYKRDPLSHVLATYPFPRSIEPFRRQLQTDALQRFELVNTYRIFNRKVGLFRNIQPKPILVHTASLGGPRTPVDILFSREDGVWHSESPPKFPITIEFAYTKAEEISELMLLPQIGEKTRAPSDFILQGRSDRGEWIDLLTVKGATTDDVGTPLHFQIVGGTHHKLFRLVILANGGSPNFVALRKLVPTYIIKGVTREE